MADCPASFADGKYLFVQASSSFTFLLRAWPAWIACPEPDFRNLKQDYVSSHSWTSPGCMLEISSLSCPRQSSLGGDKHRSNNWLSEPLAVSKLCSMGFRDPFQYRTRSEIDKGWPDLHSGNKEWNLKKIYKVKTSCLKLLLNIKELFEVRMDTVWISQLYFQRYFSQNSFQTNTPVVFMAACVHLACKANDQPRPIDTVMKRIFKLRHARDPMELKKIDNMMVFVEFKERVLLAERALLYAFAFDFAKGDPYSFALKYNRLHSTESLVDSDAAELFFTWLTFAGQATTLCLQYPPSLLAVASLWYAQHLSKGQVPKDSNGQEFWESLPVEKQDRVALPAPTAEMIQDMHWQLVPELSEESFRLMLKKYPHGRLPGADCSCKACLVHQAKVAAAAASPAAAPAEASAAAADAAVRQALPADAAKGVLASPAGPQPLAACMQDKKDSGAAAPRTGTKDASLAITSSQRAALSSALAGPSVVPPDLQPSRAVPGRIQRPASAPPTALGSPSQAGRWTPGSSNRGSQASPSSTAHQLPSGQARHTGYPGVLPQAAAQSGPQHQVNGDVPLPSDVSAAVSHSPQLQSNAHPAVGGQQQDRHQQADAVDDNDSLEEGEIEEGEVLPDGSIAGATSNDAVHDANINGHIDAGGTSVAAEVPPVASSRKRIVSPNLADADGLHAAKKRATQT